MMILAFKLLITPVLIGTVTLAGRRWGSIVSGLLIGLPLTSGPISFILAHQFGLEFASRAAIGCLIGQVSICAFCVSYTLVARKAGWLICILTGIAAFLACTALGNAISWELLPALLLLLSVIALAVRTIPQHKLAHRPSLPPKWDLPARIVTATSFVIALTTVANTLGPQLSGLISPFPIFGIVFAAFTHSQQGAKATTNLLRGIVLGSGSYAAFFLIVGALLTHAGIALTYLMASTAAITISGMYYRLSHKNRLPAID